MCSKRLSAQGCFFRLGLDEVRYIYCYYLLLNKYQNNTRVSAETVRLESTYIILFLTRHNESIMAIKTTIFTHRPRDSLAQFRSADGVTIDCWWRHDEETIVTRSCE